MSSYYWIKLYQDILRDPKMGRLSDSAWRRCIELFLMAGEQEVRDGTLPDFDDLAWNLRISREQLDSDWHELERAGIVTVRDGAPIVVKFEDRQQAMGATERKRRQRKRDTKKHKRDTQKSQQRHGAVTKRDTDIDIDIDIDREVDKEIEKEYVYIHPDPEPIAELKTAMSEVTKTPIHFHADDYDKASYALSGWDATPEKVRKFADWWKRNGYYRGKPALKTLVSEWTNYDAGITTAGKNGARVEADGGFYA